MSGLSGPQRKVLLHLMSVWPCVRGRFNFLNLSRYSSCCFSSKLDLDWNLIQTHPNFPELCHYGVIVP